MGLKFRRGTSAQKSGSLAFGEPYVNTDLGTLQVGGATGDITLGSSGTGSQGSFAGISGSSLDITGNAKIDGNLTLGVAITIGDATADTVNVVASLSSSLIPQTTNAFDLGSPSKQWRHVYISTGSVYMNGVAILSSNATDLILTTDTGQSLKLLETAADTITLQTAEGNIALNSTGAGDIILDPNTGVISVKGTLQIQDGNKITSSGGNAIQFGNNVGITGSLRTTTDLTVGGNFTVNGTTTTIDSTNINIGDNIIVLNGTETTNGGMYVKDAAGGNTATGSMLWDTTNDKWIAGPKGSELAILRVGGDSVVSGSSQITYTSISSIPAGIVSGSAQTITNLPTGTVSGSSQVILSSTTGYGTVINQNLLTTSDVRHNSLGIGMAASATAGRIDASGDVVAYSTSDIRFKENIVPIEHALDKIFKISGNTYDWKADMKEFHGFEGNDVGVIAQEIEAVLPQLVTTRETGYKAVKYDKLVALLIEGIKEQQQQIGNLTIEIEKLKESKGL